MRESFRRYLLPPTLLILQSLLLLPILVPYRPDNSSNPESALQVALNSARYAFPLASIAFATVTLTSLFVRSRYENRIPWVLLFIFGVIEESVRWGLVRYLSQLEGGGGGYGAKKPDPQKHTYLLSAKYGSPKATSVEVEPGIWEGIYIMGWFWATFDCLYTWWLLRPPNLSESTPTLSDDGIAISSRPQSYHSWRKEHVKRRSADFTIRTTRSLSRKTDSSCTPIDQNLQHEQNYLTTDESISIQQGLFGNFEERASSPELSRRSIREEDDDAGDEETSATDNDNDALDSPLTPTKYRPAYHAAVPTQLARTTTDEEEDQEESTPTQQKHNARFLMPGSVTSDSDYFGRSEPAWTVSNTISPKRQVSEPSRRLSVLVSDSETESPISGNQTPLLSSSIPLEQEQTCLLDRPNVTSYGSMQQFQSASETLPPPPEMQMNLPNTSTRPFIISHPSYLSITTGDEAEDESDTQMKGGSLGRAYPSHPAFSSSYIHHHFPSSGISNITNVQNTPTNTPFRLSRPKLATSQSLPVRKGKAKRPRSYPGALQQGVSPALTPSYQTIRYYWRINGVDVDSITYFLAMFWAIIIFFQHIGYNLWYVWFPTPLFGDVVQWWSIIFFIGIAFSKGIYVAQTGSGWVTSIGLLWPTTIGCAISSFILYFVALILWGVLW
ncbi:hypothetical protein H072_4089 [Dactylellina haptotyla CBS 200.50]|uniref:Uncharacterized protein n=1 Tax=Dactylellina haptotyla (strain CBS 200.50) TaxID=1284197 RepID=S8AFV5_DACHA|nr:hypothetical protein H072_4089 [Dactylellina haptotyla CBS 200.50]